MDAEPNNTNKTAANAEMAEVEKTDNPDVIQAPNVTAAAAAAPVEPTAPSGKHMVLNKSCLPFTESVIVDEIAPIQAIEAQVDVGSVDLQTASGISVTDSVESHLDSRENDLNDSLAGEEKSEQVKETKGVEFEPKVVYDENEKKEKEDTEGPLNALDEETVDEISPDRSHQPDEDRTATSQGKEVDAVAEKSDESAATSASLESPARAEERARMREQLIEQYRQAVIDHKVARETNLQLQTKLAEYFRRKKADAAEQQSGSTSIGGSTADTVVDYDQRYTKYVASLNELRQQYKTMQANYQKQIEELKQICAQRQDEVDENYRDFINYKYGIGKKALHSRTGRPLNPKDLAAMISNEQKKETVVMEVRLENIKLRNEVAKVEAILKSKEELGEGLHLIDFEQLKIENQTYNEKIEERNEELSKLRRKIASTVQIMSHVKEKLQAVQHDNAQQRQRLGIADAELTFNRDQLTRLKQTRDHLRSHNAKLRRQCGLLGKNALLYNYENSVDAVATKKAILEETKTKTQRYQQQTKRLVNRIEKLQRARSLSPERR